MTIESNDRRYLYNGNGVSTGFNGPRAFAATDVKVYLITDGVPALVPTNDYTVTGVGRRNTRIEFNAAPAAGQQVLILRDVAYDQPTDLTNQGPFLPEIHEHAFDRQVMQIQQIADEVGRAFKLPETSTANVSFDVPEPEPLALLSWNETGDRLTNTPATQFVAAATAGVPFTVNVSAGQTSIPLPGLKTPWAPQAVFYNGIFQEPSAYTYDGGGITFNEALPADGRVVTVAVFGSPTQITESDALTFKLQAADSVTRAVRDKLSDTVSVKDFGAVGDGVTDDTARILAAAADAGEGGSLFFPAGTYVFRDHDGDGIGLTVPSGQRWYGAGPDATILLLREDTVSIEKAITFGDEAAGCVLEGMRIDGNRENITPAVDLYSNFFLVVGPKAGKRITFRNLVLANSWGRALQTSDETHPTPAEDVLVEDVRIVNGGTKGVSATNSHRVQISGCFAEIDPYAAADHPGNTNAASGSCFEVSKSRDVTISGCHGKQIGTIAAPGIRIINGSSAVRAFGNSIEGASYLAFIQTVNDVDFYGNTGRDIRGNAILITDADALQPNDTCKRIRVHHNTVIDPTGAYVLTSAVKDGVDAYVEAYVYENDFIKTSSGSPTHGIYNTGVAAPATGGEVLLYQWGNTFTGTIPNRLSGPAAAEIRDQPSTGWRMLAQSSVAASHTGNTTETVLATITVPANRMGKNGRLKITAHWSYSNNANNKITRVRFDGLQMVAATNTTTAQQRTQIEICNRNSLSAQIVSIPGLAAGFGTTATAVLTQTVDTSADRNITLTAQLADGADSVTLESYSVEIYFAP